MFVDSITTSQSYLELMDWFSSKKHVRAFKKGIGMFKTIILLFTAVVFVTSSLSAQGCCSGGTPLSGSLGLQATRKGAIMTDLNYDYNTQRSLVSGSDQLGDNPRVRNTHSAIARLGYAFNDKWMATGLLSFIRQEEVTTLNTGGTKSKRAEGIGDAVVFAQYTLLAKEKLTVLLATGVEIPLGSTTATDAETGLPLHPDLQAGRGAWSLINSAMLTVNDILRPTTILSLQATYRNTTPADRYEGLQEYRFGNELRLLAGLSDQLLLGTVLLDPSFFVLYRHTQVDEINGLPSPNTSGNWIHLRPGVEWPIHPDLRFGGFVEFPVWWDLEGTQLTTSFRTRFSLRYTFGGMKNGVRSGMEH
jgi:hypothetical protein